ncbi:MAG: terminase small subunit [Oscillospiraceae bacterium]|nr:terminase small subunit [Oscillospiraceae bacterium]
MDREITKERVLRELADIAFCDIADYCEITEDETLRLRPTAQLSRSSRAAIAAIKTGTKGVEIKFADKLSALEKLGRYLGIFDKNADGDAEELDGLMEEIFGGGDEDT